MWVKMEIFTNEKILEDVEKKYGIFTLIKKINEIKNKEDRMVIRDTILFTLLVQTTESPIETIGLLEIYKQKIYEVSQDV